MTVCIVKKCRHSRVAMTKFKVRKVRSSTGRIATNCGSTDLSSCKKVVNGIIFYRQSGHRILINSMNAFPCLSVTVERLLHEIILPLQSLTFPSCTPDPRPRSSYKLFSSWQSSLLHGSMIALSKRIEL